MGIRKMYSTNLDVDLLKEIKILAAQLDLRQNDLLEEAIRDLIEKYKHPELRVSNGWVTLIHLKKDEKDAKRKDEKAIQKDDFNTGI